MWLSDSVCLPHAKPSIRSLLPSMESISREPSLNSKKGSTPILKQKLRWKQGEPKGWERDEKSIKKTNLVWKWQKWKNTKRWRQEAQDKIMTETWTGNPYSPSWGTFQHLDCLLSALKMIIREWQQDKYNTRKTSCHKPTKMLQILPIIGAWAELSTQFTLGFWPCHCTLHKNSKLSQWCRQTLNSNELLSPAFLSFYICQ